MIGDSIVAKQRKSGHYLAKSQISGNWTDSGGEIPMLHVVGYHDESVIAVGYDRRLYTASENTASEFTGYTDATSWTVLPNFEGVESAALDSEAGWIYVVLTEGEIRRYRLDEMDTADLTTKLTKRNTVYIPDYKVC